MSAFADPPQTAKAAATRERLLELAAQMFVRDGYHPVSLRDIADEAGLTKGAIYGHFRSKGQLLIEVIRHLQARLDEAVHFDTDLDGFAAMYDLFINEANTDLRVLRVDAAAAARHDPDVAAGVEEIDAARRRWVLDNIAAKYDDPDTTYFIINALQAGVGVEEAHGRKPPDPDRWHATLSRMLDSAMKDQP